VKRQILNIFPDKARKCIIPEKIPDEYMLDGISTTKSTKLLILVPNHAGRDFTLMTKEQILLPSIGLLDVIWLYLLFFKLKIHSIYEAYQTTNKS
jgi:hypothetical protein